MAEPTLPTEEEIAKLPRWAQVAFAARCARRALPLFAKHWPGAPERHLEAVAHAVSAAERAAGEAAGTFGPTLNNGDSASGAAHFASAHFAADAARASDYAVWAAHYASRVAAVHCASRVAQAHDLISAIRSAANAAFAAGRAGLAKSSIAADFATVRDAATKDGWDDNTPVPPTVFEPTTPETFPPWREANQTITPAASPPALQEARRNEDVVMRKNHPGEYVAYKDMWEAPVLRREIVVHDRSLKTVHAALAHLSEGELNLVKVTYCDGPAESASFRGGYDNERLPSAGTTSVGE